MADYYQYSCLTISATTVTVNGGLFGVVSGTPRIVRLPYRNKDGEQQGFFYLQCMDEATLSGDYDEDIRKSNLLSRGWVFQEWMLSRRLLTFSGAGDLSVHCKRQGPLGVGGDLIQNMGDRSLSYRRGLDISLSSLNEVITSWFRLVEIYSRLALTDLTKDRFVALLGLTREFHLALGSHEGPSGHHQYASGSWFPVMKSLLWEQDHVGEMRRVEGIPTWSWASLAVPVREEGILKMNKWGKEVLSGMPIQWPASPHSRPDTELCRLEGVYSVPVDTGFRPRFEGMTRKALGLQVDDRFNLLKIEGKLVPVNIHGPFAPKADRDKVAYLTGYNRASVGRESWRRVAIDGEPDIIAGWASIEHGDYQTDVSQEISMLALIVASLSESLRSFQVVYLRRADVGIGLSYERVGVGSLFGRAVKRQVEGAEAQVISLI